MLLYTEVSNVRAPQDFLTTIENNCRSLRFTDTAATIHSEQSYCEVSVHDCLFAHIHHCEALYKYVYTAKHGEITNKDCAAFLRSFNTITRTYNEHRTFQNIHVEDLQKAILEHMIFKKIKSKKKGVVAAYNALIELYNIKKSHTQADEITDALHNDVIDLCLRNIGFDGRQISGHTYTLFSSFFVRFINHYAYDEYTNTKKKTRIFQIDFYK